MEKSIEKLEETFAEEMHVDQKRKKIGLRTQVISIFGKDL